MTADLPPDVRDRAAQAVEAEFRLIDEWLSHGVSLRVVDAVAAVVAEEIERPLQARIAELEGALKFIAEDVCTAPSWVKTNCLDESPSDLCPVCTARASLAKGEKR